MKVLIHPGYIVLKLMATRLEIFLLIQVASLRPGHTAAVLNFGKCVTKHCLDTLTCG